jgi:hypothetical protein
MNADGGGFSSKNRLGGFSPGLSGGTGTRSQHSLGNTWTQTRSVEPSPDVTASGNWPVL